MQLKTGLVHFLTLLVLVLLPTAFAVAGDTFPQGTQIPEGWTALSAKEVVKIWGPNGLDTYLAVSEDFNGDGITDEARLLFNERRTALGLFVFLSEGDSFSTILLDRVEGGKWIFALGIYPVLPGTYTTACAKGYGDECREDAPREVVLKNPGINFFLAESSNSYFYWDEGTASFLNVPISD